MRVLALIFVFQFLSGVVSAAEGVNVQTSSSLMRLGGEFRSEVIWKNHGFERINEDQPNATSSLGVTTARLKLSGVLRSQTEYAFRFDLLDNDSNREPLDYGYGTHWFAKVVGLSFGKMKVQQGGFDNMDESYRVHVKPDYRTNLVYPDRYEPMFALQVNAAGKLLLQILNDIVGSSKNLNRWNKRERQTWILSYRAPVGPIESMINCGSYDSHHSLWVDVGVRAEIVGLLISADYWMNKESLKGLRADNSVVSIPQVATNLSVNLSYSFVGKVRPWVHYSKFERIQANTGKDGQLLESAPDSTSQVRVSSVDRKYNLSSSMLDDNSMTAGFGADVLSLGDGWAPFFAVIASSAKFLKNNSLDLETRHDFQIKLGVLGEI